MKVTFINERGQRVTKAFSSEFLCRKFVNKMKRSRRCTLISYPLFG